MLQRREARRCFSTAPPYPLDGYHNHKRYGWEAYYTGRAREACPFPVGRSDLQAGYREGWDAAKAHAKRGKLS